MVEVEYIKGGKVRRMEKRFADILIKLGHVRAILVEKPEPPATVTIRDGMPIAEISERTGLPKRAYRRRDMTAEEE